jgi:hypothetical protein
MVDRQQPAALLAGRQPGVGRLAEIDPADVAQRPGVTVGRGDLPGRAAG